MAMPLRGVFLRNLVLFLFVVGLAVGGYFAWRELSAPAPHAHLRLAAAERGELLATVTATGTIQPEEVVDVGAQVVGMIKSFGTDPKDPKKRIDYGSEVEEGTILARIDDALYKARFDKTEALVDQGKWQVAQAQADLERAEADVLQSKAKNLQAQREFDRAKKLMDAKAIGIEEFDAKQAALDVSRADIVVTNAAVAQAKAAKQRSEKTLLAAHADLKEAQQILDYTIIKSPVKGVIVDRRVGIGQTVVSSLNAPSLFLIAKDLKRLQIWASVNEADISRIKPGQNVRFTVDTYPNESFRGEVAQVRLNATMTSNVVTYTVVVNTDNANLRLRPYLTANLKFEIDRRQEALLVPNAALRWQPNSAEIVPEARGQFTKRGRKENGPSSSSDAKTADGIVWVPTENGLVRPVSVRLGMTDGIATEILGDSLQPGQQIVVGEIPLSEADGSATPFLPRMTGGGNRGGQR